ncbi:MAG: sensor hybrid histidine kinase [Candidatus Solibacter sp.]|nr:sensor hybrid histidine kinase [Candidatus Solibacter sp.]
MDRLRTKGLLTTHNLWLTSAIIIVVAIAVYSRLDADAFRDAAASATKSRLIIQNTQALLSLLKDAESGQRGYLLTGDTRYLTQYSQAIPAIAQRLRDLQQLTDATRPQQKTFASLVNSKLAELEQTIEFRRQGDLEAAMAMVRTDEGRQTMDQLRTLASRIIGQQVPQFEESRARAQRHGYQTRILVQVGAIALALMLWFATRRINRLVHAQEALIDDLDATRERESRGRSAMETTLRSIADAVITTDSDGRVTLVNSVAERLTGWTNAQAGGHPLKEVFRIKHEDTRRPDEDLTARVLREGDVVTLTNHAILLTRDGREIPIDDSAAPILDDQGKITGVVIVFRDVTLRRRAQRELEESESRYRLLFEANPSPMWVYDVNTLAFLAVNSAATAHYGYTAAEFLAMTLRDIRPPEDVPALLEDTRIPTEQLHTDGPWRHCKKDGTIIFVEITAHPIQFGSARGCFVMANDVTERKGLEDQLRQSQKLEAVGQLAGGIAHDFNNLLTVIEGYAEMIRADQLPDDPHREPLEEILVAAQRAAALTRQLLAFSRRQVLQPVRLSLNANVASTQRMLSRLLGEHIQIRTVLAADLVDVWADPGQIDQIILNLAVNGRDAMERGGTLTIGTSNVELGENEAKKVDASPGEYARLSLTDTGTGMDEETQRHIFEPFFTTKEVGRGTGLGLSTVYGIVKQSGGYICVSSEPGKGSTFSICLPRARGPVGATARSTAAGTALGSGSTILLVEDDATVQQLVSAMLKSSGYRVIATATPSEALRICSEFSTHIDLLLTDMVLPDGDGGEIAENAVALRPGLKVLYMSGYTEHPMLCGPNFDSNAPFLQKPFTKAALMAKIREALQ